MKRNLALVPALTTEEPLPCELEDVARALGEALALQFRTDNSRNPERFAAAGVRNPATPAGFNQRREEPR